MAKLEFTASEIASKKYVDDAIANAGGGVTVDQTYSPTSENAQSGKAVAQAVSSRVPKKVATPGAPFPSVIATSNGGYDEYGIPTDDSYMCIDTVGDELGKDVNNNGTFINSIPRRDNKGNLFTGTPIDEQDCANKKYVDDKIAAIPGGGGAVDDVQINGNSVVTDGVANISVVTNTPYGEAPKLGVVGVQNSTYGINITTDGLLQIKSPNNDVINQRNTWSFRYYNALTLDKIDYAVKVAMCDGNGAEWTVEEKTAARDRMGIETWEVIADVTIDNPCQRVHITKDMNGNPFNLKKAYIVVDYYKNGDINTNLRCSMTNNSNSIVWNYFLLNWQLIQNSATHALRSAIIERICGINKVISLYSPPNDKTMSTETLVSSGSNSYSRDDSVVMGMLDNIAATEEMKGLMIGSYQETIGVGTKIKLYGVRV